MAAPPPPPAPAQKSFWPAICPGHQKAVSSVHFAHADDGSLYFVTASLDKLPMLRDGVSGDWEGTFSGHKGAVWCAKLNRGATLAATASADFTVKVWDAVNGGEVRTLEHGHVVKSLDFSRDGGRLATGGQDKKLRVYSVADWGAPPAVFPQPDKLRCVVWAADGASIFTGSEEGALRAWDAATGALLRELSLGAPVSDVELSPDGATLTVAAGSTLALVDAGTLALRRKHALRFQAECASLHPTTGRTVVAGGSDVWVHVIDADTGAELATLKGHHGTIHCIRFAPDGRTFVSGADDAIVRIWAAEDSDAGAAGCGQPSPTAAAVTASA